MSNSDKAQMEQEGLTATGLLTLLEVRLKEKGRGGEKNSQHIPWTCTTVKSA